MAKTTELTLVSGDTLRTNGVTFRIIRSDRVFVYVEVASPGEVELLDDAPDVSETATDPNAAGLTL